MRTEDRRDRVRMLFDEALEQPDERRGAYLSTACEGDPTLRREVESLLAAYAAAGGFLETPAYTLQARVDAAGMAFRRGDRVGSFDVIAVLGRGGMGEVYRAHDAKLGRDVALKVLPRAVAADPDRLARFERESRILASLNHPNTAAIHSVEQVDAVRLLVLELVEGPTLAERLRDGPLAADEALGIARQLAVALEAAHGRGVVHRDLKPSNIKLTTSSGIKLLDFGLAKAQVGRDLASAVTAMTDRTADGAIIGTYPYMSPEQARGNVVDERADIWAFGCVLFEMLTATRAFARDTSSDTIAAVLEHEPPWARLPATTPPGIRRLLRRCLEKDPDDRLHDIADARIEIDDTLAHRDELPATTPQRGRVITIALIVALAVASLGFEMWRRAGTSGVSAGPAVRFTWRSRRISAWTPRRRCRLTASRSRSRRRRLAAGRPGFSCAPSLSSTRERWPEPTARSSRSGRQMPDRSPTSRAAS